MTKTAPKPLSRLQQKNRTAILLAALDVFSQNGFRGATLDKIADVAGMSKPNLIYYFPNKDAIFATLLDQVLEEWFAPLREIDPKGDGLEEILKYIRRKVRMSHDMPRESRLFANEIVQGAPRMGPEVSEGLKWLFDKTCAVLKAWMDKGEIARCDPEHLLFSIWATTQHYADFEVQITALQSEDDTDLIRAEEFLVTLYTKMLKVEG